METTKKPESSNASPSEAELKTGDSKILVMLQLLSAISVNILIWTGCSKIHPQWIVWTIIFVNSMPTLLPIYHRLYPSSCPPGNSPRAANRWHHSKEDASDLAVFRVLSAVMTNLYTWINVSSEFGYWALVSIVLSFVGVGLTLYAHFFPAPKPLPVTEGDSKEV